MREFFLYHDVNSSFAFAAEREPSINDFKFIHSYTNEYLYIDGLCLWASTSKLWAICLLVLDTYSL